MLVKEQNLKKKYLHAKVKNEVERKVENEKSFRLSSRGA